jgi:N-acetylmuramoyl-L-alanine amidase
MRSNPAIVHSSETRTEGAFRAFFRVRLAPLVLILATLMSTGNAAEQKRLAIFSVAANYYVPVVERDGRDYVGVVEMLDPLGTVSAQNQGSHWTAHYNDAPVEFTAKKTTVRVRGQEVELPAPFLLEGNRGLVPLSGVGSLLPRILGGPVTFHEAARRLLIGSVGVHFTAQIGKSDPPALVMNFSSPVNPMISTEPGKLLMVFARDPLVAPGTSSLSFGNKAIPSANYDEGNGTAIVTVNGSGSLFASFSNAGKTITITATSSAAAPAVAKPSVASAPPSAPTPPAQSTPPPEVATAAEPVPPVRYFAVIDASHGGTERGAALSDQLAEKDVTLAFSRRLRQDLQSQGIPAMLLRDGDNSLTLDQRAEIANRVHPAIYICVHASSDGNGVRLYSPLVPAGAANLGIFFDWNSAQTNFLPLSRAFASALGSELQRKRLAVRVRVAPLRPLNNITRPAIAVELAPPASGIADINSPGYQELVASSVTIAILSMRSQLEAGR